MPDVDPWDAIIAALQKREANFARRRRFLRWYAVLIAIVVAVYIAAWLLPPP